MPLKSTKKKKTAKTTKKRSKRRKPAKSRAKSRDQDVDLIDQHTQVWTVYGRVRSIVKTAAELNITVGQVRTVLNFDKVRHERVKQDAIEEKASQWEEHENRALALLTKAVGNLAGDLLEIEKAVEEDRMTTIRNEDGIKLPVLNARQLMITAKIVDQLTNLATKASAIAAATRMSHVPDVSDADNTGLPEVPDFSKFSALQLCQMIENVIDPEKVPPGLRLKAQRIRDSLKKAPNC